MMTAEPNGEEFRWQDLITICRISSLGDGLFNASRRLFGHRCHTPVSSLRLIYTQPDKGQPLRWLHGARWGSCCKSTAWLARHWNRPGSLPASSLSASCVFIRRILWVLHESIGFVGGPVLSAAGEDGTATYPLGYSPLGHIPTRTFPPPVRFPSRPREVPNC